MPKKQGWYVFSRSPEDKVSFNTHDTAREAMEWHAKFYNLPYGASIFAVKEEDAEHHLIGITDAE